MKLGNILVASLFFICHTVYGSQSEQIPLQEICNTSPKKIAIIGAGAGGSSTAYHLRLFATDAGTNVTITIFEREPYIGGRSTTVNAWNSPDHPIELGASVFVKINKILVSAVRDFDLSIKEPYNPPSGPETPDMGVWNGREFVLVQKSEGSWWDNAKLLWKYGLSPLRTIKLVKSTANTFLKLYDEPQFPFKDITEAAYSLGLTSVSSVSGDQFLREENIGDLFANEVIQAGTRAIYALNLPRVHALATLVALATDEAMSVMGGNWQIFDRMAHTATGDIRLNTTVTRIGRQSNGKFLVKSQSTDSKIYSDITGEDEFDTVVLASPYQFSNIDMSPEIAHIPTEISYIRLHVTIFSSPRLLSPAAFNLPAGSLVPETVLTTLQPGDDPSDSPDEVGSPGIFVIHTVASAFNPTSNPPGRKEYLYKIFSPALIDSSEIARFLGFDHTGSKDDKFNENDVSWLYRKIWHSYPVESPRSVFEKMKLAHGLWYTSAIDSFISSMETNSLMGKNIARLIVDEYSAKP